MSRGLNVGPTTAAVLAAVGIDTRAVLARAGLPGDLFARDTTIAADRYVDLWAAVETEFGRPDLAVHLAGALRVEALDPPLIAGLCSADLVTAARRIAVYKRLIGPMELHVDLTPERLRLEIGWTAAAALPASLIETELLFWVVFARTGTHEEVVPRRLSLPHRRDETPALRAFVGSTTVVRTGDPVVAIEFGPVDARRPFLTRNNAMWDLVEPGLRRSLADLDASATWADRVSAVLVRSLAAGVDTIAPVAAELAVSSRSLQRHLAAEGTTYARVLAATRERIAVHYLRHSTLGHVEIALLLGYDEPTSFHRAFHAWTGRTPGSLRAVPA